MSLQLQAYTYLLLVYSHDVCTVAVSDTPIVNSTKQTQCDEQLSVLELTISICRQGDSWVNLHSVIRVLRGGSEYFLTHIAPR